MVSCAASISKALPELEAADVGRYDFDFGYCEGYVDVFENKNAREAEQLLSEHTDGFDPFYGLARVIKKDGYSYKKSYYFCERPGLFYGGPLAGITSDRGAEVALVVEDRYIVITYAFFFAGPGSVFRGLIPLDVIFRPPLNVKKVVDNMTFNKEVSAVLVSTDEEASPNEETQKEDLDHYVDKEFESLSKLLLDNKDLFDSVAEMVAIHPQSNIYMEEEADKNSDIRSDSFAMTPEEKRKVLEVFELLNSVSDDSAIDDFVIENYIWQNNVCFFRHKQIDGQWCTIELVYVTPGDYFGHHSDRYESICDNWYVSLAYLI